MVGHMRTDTRCDRRTEFFQPDYSKCGVSDSAHPISELPLADRGWLYVAKTLSREPRRVKRPVARASTAGLLSTSRALELRRAILVEWRRRERKISKPENCYHIRTGRRRSVVRADVLPHLVMPVGPFVPALRAPVVQMMSDAASREHL